MVNAEQLCSQRMNGLPFTVHCLPRLCAMGAIQGCCLTASSRCTMHRSFAVFAIAMRGHGQAEGMGPEMGHAAEKIYWLFRIFIL